MIHRLSSTGVDHDHYIFWFFFIVVYINADSDHTETIFDLLEKIYKNWNEYQALVSIN